MVKYILIALAGVLVVGVLIIMSRRKSLSFDFDLGGNISSILDLVSGRYSNPGTGAERDFGAYINMPLSTIIKNNKPSTVTLNNILGGITYDGQPIIQTNPNSAVLDNVTLPGNQRTTVTDNAQILVNPSSIKFLKELVAGNKPVIKYNFGTTILGKPYQFSNTATVNKGEDAAGRKQINELLYNSNGYYLNGNNGREKACCSGCLEYSHTLEVAVGNYPAGTKVYKCNKTCNCGSFS